MLAENSRALLGAYDASVTGISHGPIRGLVRVTAPLQFGRRHIAPLVVSFLNEFPDTQVELVLHDRNLDLIEHGLDVAVRIGALSDSSLLVRHVGQVRFVLVASPDYLSRRGTPRRPHELASHDAIFNTIPQGPPEWRFRARGRDTVVRLAPRLLVNEIEARLGS